MLITNIDMEYKIHNFEDIESQKRRGRKIRKYNDLSSDSINHKFILTVGDGETGSFYGYVDKGTGDFNPKYYNNQFVKTFVVTSITDEYSIMFEGGKVSGKNSVNINISGFGSFVANWSIGDNGYLAIVSGLSVYFMGILNQDVNVNIQ